MLVKGKVALVTGGASGIGLACIEEMLKNDLVGGTIVDINEQDGIVATNNLNDKYGKGKVIFVKASVANKNELDDAFKKTIEIFKQLDIVFNNAGIFDEANYERCIDVNLKGTVHGLKLAIDEYLLKHKSGETAVVINTASIAGLVPSNPVEIYSTTKHAIVGLTRNFGCDFHLKRTGVKVIAICPASTITPIFDKALNSVLYTDLKYMLEKSCSTQQQTAEELAKCFLRILEREDNGSVWFIQEGKEVKVEFPKLF